MDKNRRKFLKIIFIGSSALLVERILNFSFSGFLNNPSTTKTNLSTKTDKTDKIDKTDSRSFRVVENKEILSIYDSSGKEIFQIDKGA